MYFTLSIIVRIPRCVHWGFLEDAFLDTALCWAGVGIAAHLKNKQLRQEKERLYKEALLKHKGIIKALKEEADAEKERVDYLQSLNILLQQAIKDLSKDLGVA